MVVQELEQGIGFLLAQPDNLSREYTALSAKNQQVRHRHHSQEGFT
jgi:hypothetical protein